MDNINLAEHPRGEFIAALSEGEPCAEREVECEAPTPASNSYPISIKQLDHGYFVEVGCKRLAIESIETLVKKLEEYLRDPAESERRLRMGEFFK